MLRYEGVDMKKKLYNAVFVFPIVPVLVIIICFTATIYLLGTTKVNQYISTTIELSNKADTSMYKVLYEDFSKVYNKDELVFVFNGEEYKEKVLDYYAEGKYYYLTLNSFGLNETGAESYDIKLCVGKSSLLSLLF